MPRVVVFDEIGDADVLHIVDEPLVDPAAGEVRVRIEAIGVNRADQMMRTGVYARPARLPHARLGCEGTGIVDAVAPDVDNIAVGDAVIIIAVPDMDIRGTYAEYTNVPATAVIPRPMGLDPSTAAALWMVYSTAYGALIEKAKMQPGDHILITAASSAVGLAAIQVANQIGAIPIAATRNSAKKNDLLSAGAAAVITTDTDDVVEAATKHTNGNGVDIIFDSVMGPDCSRSPKRRSSAEPSSPWAGSTPGLRPSR
jgi:NADPH:quinone reductase